MTQEEFNQRMERNKEFINSMFVPKADEKPIFCGIYIMRITFKDEPDNPITPVGHFTRRKLQIKLKTKQH